MTRDDMSSFISGEKRWNDPAVERNSENTGELTISRSTRRNSENKVQLEPFRSGLSVRICDSSKARMTRGHRGPPESNTPRGSMNLQSFSPASVTFPSLLFSYFGGPRGMGGTAETGETGEPSGSGFSGLGM
jgi:hypothetical protein